MNLSFKQAVFFIIIISILIKLSYVIATPYYTSVSSQSNMSERYIKIAKNNDAWWYQKIIDNGYPQVQSERDLGYCEWPDFKQSEWAFFPMYPIMVKGLNYISGLKSDYSSIISIILSTLAMIGVFWLAQLLYKDVRKAFYITLLLFLFPFHFYYSVFYTESLFLCCLIFSFIAIKTQKYFLLLLLLIPLVLVRPNGLFMLLPLYLFHLEIHIILKKYAIKWTELFNRKNIIKSLFFLSGVVAFGLYCLYQYDNTGFYNAFSIAQKG